MKNISKRITVTISGLVFDSPKPQKILLIKREKDPFNGMWSFPGGHLEYGELAEHGIAREVREETGYAVKFFPSPFFSLNEVLLKDRHYIVLSKCCYIDPLVPQNTKDKENIYQEFFYLDRYLPHLKDAKYQDYRPLSSVKAADAVRNFYQIFDIQMHDLLKNTRKH